MKRRGADWQTFLQIKQICSSLSHCAEIGQGNLPPPCVDQCPDLKVAEEEQI